MNVELENDITEEQKKSPSKNKNNEQMRKKMILYMGVILGIILVILIIVFLFSLFGHKKYSYEEVENIMKESAEQYYKDHPKKLPQNKETMVSIDANTLIKNNYMKEFDQYLNNSICTGKVEVLYNNGNYVYTPYLECGDKYATKTLFQKLTNKDKLVTTGYGLYQMNGEYVYRGEIVDNYVALDNNEENLWRIVKFTSTKEAVLIRDELLDSNVWDNRFNTTQNYNTGINDYSISRIKDHLQEIYTSPKDYEKILTSDAKKLLVPFNVCSGSRLMSHNVNDNSAECSKVEQNQNLGLLTVSDYLNASMDSNCTTTLSKSCQNYNYLKAKYDWWLITANPSNNYEVYYVKSSGYIATNSASSYAKIRPVIHLNANVIYESGNGTVQNPYRVR